MIVHASVNVWIHIFDPIITYCNLLGETRGGNSIYLIDTTQQRWIVAVVDDDGRVW